MNDEFVKNIINLYGESGRKWLSSIPQTIENYKQKWGLEIFPPFYLSYNFVAPAKKTDGTKVVLKIGHPKDAEILGEIDALTAFQGDGCARLINFDKSNNVILIEHIEPGIPLSNLKNDELATRILASLMKKIKKPLPKNHQFITIKKWTKELEEFPEIIKSYKTPPIPYDLVKKAGNLFDELITTSKEEFLLHGDLHHDNVLSAIRETWLAIDPKGIVAERAYETAVMIRNPYKKLKDEKNLEELFQKRIKILSAELELDPKRILKWCFAQTVLSGVWSRDNIKYSKFAIKVAQALENITNIFK